MDVHIRGVDAAVWQRARVVAVQQEMTMGKLVTWALRAFVTELPPRPYQPGPALFADLLHSDVVQDALATIAIAEQQQSERGGEPDA